jgi:hypothetical protein
MLLTLLLGGCAGVKTSDMIAGFGDRLPPDVGPGQEIVLLERSSKVVTTLVGSDGYVHVFALGQSADLHHAVVSKTNVIKRESIGTVAAMEGPEHESRGRTAIDAIEHPRGALRVAVKGTQYIQVVPGGAWEKSQNSLCDRYLVYGERLFCAGIAKGKEIGTPIRRDVTFGLLGVLPLWWSTQKQSDKLVLAEEIDGAWHVSAVVDPEEPFDIDPDFFAGIDAKGTIHLLYGGSRGGGLFAVVGAGGPGFAGGAGSIGAPSVVRFAQVPVDNLKGGGSLARSGAGIEAESATPVRIKGAALGKMPFMKRRDAALAENPEAWLELRPFAQKFSLDRSSGEIRGLMWAERMKLDDGERRATFNTLGDFPRALDSSWVSVSMLDGRWLNHFDVVTGDDVPVGFSWWSNPEALARVDANGKLHALLIATGKRNVGLSYVTDGGIGWSAPLILGLFPGSSLTSLGGDVGRSLAFTREGDAFVTWVNAEGALVGRFLYPASGRP